MENWLITENIFLAAALITAITVMTVAVIKTSKFVKRIVHFTDDFLGEKERPGVPARPGLTERLHQLETCTNRIDERLNLIEYKVQSIDKELQPNSGLSLRDAVSRIEKRLERVEGD